MPRAFYVANTDWTVGIKVTLVLLCFQPWLLTFLPIKPLHNAVFGLKYTWDEELISPDSCLCYLTRQVHRFIVLQSSSVKKICFEEKLRCNRSLSGGSGLGAGAMGCHVGRVEGTGSALGSAMAGTVSPILPANPDVWPAKNLAA